ncbi:hypothetical protein PoB_007719800 [Plakobranchus ocellatus]|uniref:Uncharacterized protein n=1 Tax=Plakobranchus ocellatus TaxID=259542 RepID=A0AAV4E3H8_9GAST|nr:hypothetical protein PoB_007719800 [Plakobranchus ocellatus]
MRRVGFVVLELSDCIELLKLLRGGRGAVAHLVGQLATIQEVRGSISNPGQVRLSLLLCVHPGGEESNGKLPHNAVCQEQPGPYSWFPDVWTKRGTLFT